MMNRVGYLLAAWLLLSSPSHASMANETSNEAVRKPRKPIYHLYDDVDLKSTVNYQSFKQLNISIKAVYPRIESDAIDESIEQFNQDVEAIIQDKINDFKSQVTQNQTLQATLSKPQRKNNLEIDYNASVITSNGQAIISVRFISQAYIAGMAHPERDYQVLNFNLDTGEKIALSDLFTPDANYLNLLAAYAQQILTKKLANPSLVNAGSSPEPEHYRYWNLKPNGLLITFADGQVAPAVYGPQTILVPYTYLKEILAQDSPLAQCKQNTKKCVKSILLTGGFIDEA